MPEINPYAAPQAPAAAIIVSDDATIGQVARGQQFIIVGILCYFAGVVGQFVIGPAAALILLATLILGVIGIIRLSRGLGYNVGVTTLFLVLMLIPLVGLVTLLVLNGKATKRLRAAGYRVGLLGASKPR